MNMFPVSTDLPARVTEQIEAGDRLGKSFLFDFSRGDFLLVDGRLAEPSREDAIAVWVEKILRTQKNRYAIYSGTQYGAQLEDLLIGSVYPPDYIEAELKREIEDALLQHPEITGITDFLVDRSTDSVAVSFTLALKEGGMIAKEVTLGGG